MSVVVITPPEPLVGLDLAKQHLRVNTAADDALINAYIAAASANIDGPSGWLGCAVGMQTLELRLDGFYAGDWRVGPAFAWEVGWDDIPSGAWPFARRIRLPYPPFVSVTQITYEDASGADQVLLPTGWKASEEGVDPSFGSSWPSGRTEADAVRIRYQAGYAQTPAPIVAAVLLMVASLYADREADVIDARAVVAENPAVQNLLSPYRVWSA